MSCLEHKLREKVPETDLLSGTRFNFNIFVLSCSALRLSFILVLFKIFFRQSLVDRNNDYKYFDEKAGSSDTISNFVVKFDHGSQRLRLTLIQFLHNCIHGILNYQIKIVSRIMNILRVCILQNAKKKLRSKVTLKNKKKQLEIKLCRLTVYRS